MKYLLLFVLAGLFAACKVNDKPKGSTNKTLPASGADRATSDHLHQEDTLPPKGLHSEQVTDEINPDECILEARVLERDISNENFTYLLEIQEVLKRGFGFHRNIKKGDRLEARSEWSNPQKLNDTASVIIAIEYVFSLKNGYFRINRIIEK